MKLKTVFTENGKAYCLPRLSACYVNLLAATLHLHSLLSLISEPRLLPCDLSYVNVAIATDRLICCAASFSLGDNACTKEMFRSEQIRTENVCLLLLLCKTQFTIRCRILLRD